MTSASRVKASTSWRPRRAIRACGCATGRWSGRRPATTRRLPAGDFALDLRCAPTQPVLLQGQPGPVAQGPAARTGQLLLQPAPARGRRGLEPAGPALRGDGQGLARPRVERGAAAPAGRGLGLDRHEPGRRQRPHRLSPAAPGWLARYGTAARFARPAAPCTPSARAKWCSARSAAGPARCRRPPTRSSGSCARRRTSTPSGP